MIGLALSGGGSRAMAFHLGCLRALHDLELLQKVGVLSTISGGSVIGAYYAYSPDKSFDEFEHDIRDILRLGFHKAIVVELLKPQHFFPGLASSMLAHAQDLLGVILKHKPRIPRLKSRSDAFERVLQKQLFPTVTMDGAKHRNLEVVIGACELLTGTAFRFGNSRSGSWRLGELAQKNVDLSFAVAASAAYPVFLPAFDRTLAFEKGGQARKVRVSLTDGGVYDNLGIQVLEPGRDSDYSLHTFSCDHIVACNAGQGQEAGFTTPLGFGMRVKRAFEVVHRRVQDSAMHHLHSLKDSGKLKGFAMPYLGQQDATLPWIPSGMVSRNDVVGYPTDFAAMSEEWIRKLSNRGEHLTRVLVSHYLEEILT